MFPQTFLSPRFAIWPHWVGTATPCTNKCLLSACVLGNFFANTLGVTEAKIPNLFIVMKPLGSLVKPMNPFSE